MATIAQFDQFLSEPFIWPGGYERVAVMVDGDMLCHRCATENAEAIRADMRARYDDPYSQWIVETFDSTNEWDFGEECCHCYRWIHPSGCDGIEPVCSCMDTNSNIV